MEPKIVSRPAFTVIGMKYRGKNENKEIPQMWDRFIPRTGEIKHKVNPHVAYGVMGNYDESSGEFDYVAGFEVESSADIPEGMVSWQVPAQTYAVFTCTLPTLIEAFQRVYQTWLPQSGYRRADGPEFELYDEKFNPEDGRLEMYIYIPVK
jgi:AraC family transcriptional regulator